ncbi:MAG TPA: HD domain-containing protein [Polyangiaceae bacterium]|nr:HD domain-containing protein [Polyangiaceae bacterium]
MREIAGIQLPDSALCQAATELAQRVSEPFLFNHVMRSCLYAECLGRQRQQTYDRELLYVSTLLHDLGLTGLAPLRERFEVEGADLAKDFLARQGMSEAALELAWDAIALHTTAGIPTRKQPVISLCHLGTACDIRGLPDNAELSALRSAVQAAYPWLALQRALPDTLAGLYRQSPAAVSSHAVADACDRLVPGFRRFNLCDVLLATAGTQAT